MPEIVEAKPVTIWNLDHLFGRWPKMLLVLVGKNTIRYNDMLGQSLEVPVEKPTANSRESKVSHGGTVNN